MKIICPKCQANLRVISDEPGEVHGCPRCGASFRSPGPTNTASVPSPPKPVVSEPPKPAVSDLAKPAVSAPTKPTVSEPAKLAVAPLESGSADDDSDDIPLAADADGFEFTVDCPLCATRMEFDHTRVGTLALCPDCHHQFTITPPSVKDRRQPLERQLQSENRVERIAIERPDQVASSLPAQQATKQLAEELLARAARELKAEELEKSHRGFDDRATRDLFAFLQGPEILVRLIVIAIIGCVAVAALIRLGVEMNQSRTTFSTLFFFCLGSGAGLVWFLAMASHAHTLLRVTANGGLTVEEWPSEPGDIVSSSLQVLAGFFYAALPGLLISALLFSPTASWPFWVIFVMLSVYILFPLTMSSVLEQNSLFAPISLPILSALKNSPRECQFFALASAPLMLFFGLSISAISLQSNWLVIPISLIQLGTTLLYFRFLGWLIGQTWLRATDDSTA